jgi:hypothetical protein
VDTLITARKLSLPLETAAEMAGVSPELAQLWLDEGRRMATRLAAGPGPARPAHNSYQRRLLEFAEQWDRALAGTLAVLRGYMMGHAKRDPKACAALLMSLERDYTERKTKRLPGARPRDLAEEYAPLDLADPRAQRVTKLTHTAADGSTTTAEVTEDAPIDDRSDAEVEYYALHGEWPEETEQPPAAEEEAIDTEGEDVAGDEVQDELAAALAAGRDPEAPPPPPALARINPLGELRELPGWQQEVTDAAPAPAPAAAPATVPDYPRLRRIDPLAGR